MALAAEFYNMPLFAYLDHLRAVRERHGSGAAILDLSFALSVRHARIEQQIELRNKANQENGS